MRRTIRAGLARRCVAVVATAAAVLMLEVGSAGAAKNLLTNGSFETGNFSGWTPTDPAGALPGCSWTVQKSPSSTYCYSTFGPPFPASISAVTGSHFANVGWDGNGPTEATLSQTVSISKARRVRLSWFDNASWNISPAAQPRVEYVDILSRTGANTFHSFTIQTLDARSFGATGWVRHTLNLSHYAGRKVEIRFRLMVPEAFTGPASFALDAVTLSTRS